MKKIESGTPNLARLVGSLSPKAAPTKTASATTASTAPTTTADPSSKTLAAQKVTLGQVASSPKAASQALQTSMVGAKIADGGFAAFTKKIVTAAMVGFAIMTTPLMASADTIFLDHNNAPLEVQMAKQLAASKGEKFILVRPDAASLDSVFAQASRGEIDARHLILSGHSSGQRVWGTGSDESFHETSIEQMKELKAKYPEAFKQVKHVHFMSCYAGSAGNSAQWSGVFPQAKIAGFWGSGPAKTQSAATQMLKNTEMTFRGLDGRSLSPAQAMIAAKQMAAQPGTNVTKFAVRLPTNDGASVHFALHGEKVTSVDAARDRADVLRARSFEPYLNAQEKDFAQPPKTHATSPLRDYYNALHTWLNAIPADDNTSLSVRNDIDVTIRLIYFDVIQAKMQANHGATFAAADTVLKNANAGFVIGDVSKLSRKDVVVLVDKLKGAGELQWAHFDVTHKADVAVVNAYLKSQSKSPLHELSKDSEAWRGGAMAGQLENDVKDAPVDVKAAATRLNAVLMAGHPAALDQSVKLLDTGLKQLSPDVIPSTWIE